MGGKAYERTLKAWVKEFRENLDRPMRELIGQANFDLYYGPTGTDEGYPGFETAVKRIKAVCADVPSTLYVDADAEGWSESEPEPEKCAACDGKGEDAYCNPCSECNGQGHFEPGGDWYRLDRKDLLTAIVGRELVEYVR